MRLKKQRKHWMKSGSRKRLIYHWPIIGLVMVVVAGCPSPTLKEDPKIKTLTKNLNTIDTVQPVDLSDSSPISVEQATTEVTDQITEPNESVPVIKLTLDQVRAATLKNNLDLKVDLIDPAIAQRSLDIERSKFEAAFYGSAAYTTSETGEGVSSTSNDFEVGVEAPLYTGGSVTVGLPFGESDSDDSDGVADAAVSVSFIQSLLRGAGTRINTHSIRIVGYQKHAVDARTKQSAISLLASADVAYWYLYMACRELEVRREQYKLAQDQLKHARLKVASGDAAKIEIVRAEAGLSSRIEALINAETEVQDCQLELQRIMNRRDMPLNANLRIDPNTEPNPLGLDIDEEKLVEIALQNRMETVQLELQLAIDELDVEMARNATLPDLRFSYHYTGQAEAGDAGHALGDFGDNTYDEHTFGLSASIPLGNQAAKARLERVRLQQLQDQASYANRRQMIQQEVYVRVRALRNSWRRILAAEQGVKAAYRDYKVEQSQFQLGRSRSTDVLYSAAGLADAQLRRISALAGYEIAQIYLARATGTLLGHSRIILEPTELQKTSYRAELPKSTSD
ncbi:MAG: TolC family protein [Sedimentisphaerales bacterium]|nr:TolC family protein [Sedimentisphaerales bacterium]